MADEKEYSDGSGFMTEAILLGVKYTPKNKKGYKIPINGKYKINYEPVELTFEVVPTE